MAHKITIKQALVDQGLVESLQEAEKLVLSKRVQVDGAVARFGGDKISNDQKLVIIPERKYFSRAGEKLDFALNEFQILVNEKICADVGASTGGFTGVLLSREAKKVFAIDVARGEIAWKLRSDARVVLMERVNAREPLILPERIDLVTIDVSFISVFKILPNVKRWLTEAGQVVVLVKPQFEAPRDLVEKGGIIRNKATHLIVLQNFLSHCQQTGFVVTKVCCSPIEGTEGNREFLAALEHAGESTEIQSVTTEDLIKVVDT